MAVVIDGKAIAAQKKALLSQRIEGLKARGRTPGLSVVLVGENPSSLLYVRNKERTALALGIAGRVYRLPEQTSQQELLSLVHALNEDPAIHGILVQMPLPQHIDPFAVTEAIAPHKDVDGLSTANVGRLIAGKPCHIPCTPRGILELIKSTHMEISARHAVVVGRSAIVGKPVSALLLQHNATVTICHSHTDRLAEFTRRADVLIAATGQAHLVNGAMIKPGAVVIDVGNSYVDGKLYGDVDFASAEAVAGYITPVPGGVGPMTIAMLMQNTVEAAQYAPGDFL